MPRIIYGDNLPVLHSLPAGTIPRFTLTRLSTPGKAQSRVQCATARAAPGDPGDRTGFQGRRYTTTRLATRAFADAYDDYLAFLEPRLVEAHRVLAADGTLYFHIDYREAHYCKALLDGIFGRASFLNEIIRAYDYGGRTRKRWPAKHDTILVYVKDPAHYVFKH